MSKPKQSNMDGSPLEDIGRLSVITEDQSENQGTENNDVITSAQCQPGTGMPDCNTPCPSSRHSPASSQCQHSSSKQTPVETIILKLSLAKRLGMKERKNSQHRSEIMEHCLETPVIKSNPMRRAKVGDINESCLKFIEPICIEKTADSNKTIEEFRNNRENLQNGTSKTWSPICRSIDKSTVQARRQHLRLPIGTHRRLPVGTHRHLPVGTHRHLPVGTQRHVPVGTQRHLGVGNKYGIRVIENNGQYLRKLPLVIYGHPSGHTQTDRPGVLVRHVPGRSPGILRSPDNVDFVYLQSIANQQVDDWRVLFDQLDRYRTGQIPVGDFRRLLRDPRFCPNMDRHTLEVLEMRCTCNEAGKRTITYQEFVNIMSNKRNPSFRLAVESQGKEDFLSVDIHPDTVFGKMVRKIAKGYLTDEVERQYYADRYTCCPPPLFIPVITLVEIGFFIYHCLDAGAISPNGPVPTKSFLIYRPDRRIEMWRFIFYMFIHAGWVHLFFNMLIQIVVGIPLEMVHGSCRILLVYMAGVLAGSLGTSIFDINAYLVGASGGVYALLAAHLANILLNYSNMELGVLKLGAILVIASADVGFAVWDRYSSEDKTPPVGYTAHLMGALAGLTVGLVVLKNFEQKLHEQYLWWIALAVYLGCTVFAIFWNVFYY